MSDTAEKLKDAQRRIGTLAKASPELFGGFARVSKVAASAGSFSAAQKELMAVAIAVSTGCEDCILYHVDVGRRSCTPQKHCKYGALFCERRRRAGRVGGCGRR